MEMGIGLAPLPTDVLALSIRCEACAAEQALEQNAAEGTEGAAQAAPGGGAMKDPLEAPDLEEYEFGWDEELQVAWRAPLSGPSVGKK